MNRVLIIILFFLSTNLYAQIFIANNGKITFFSEAPLEDISAVNNKVSAVYDKSNKQIVFKLSIKDFIFPIPLMQEHFNENYLESDVYPNSIFQAEVVATNVKEIGDAKVEGDLTIHGITNKIIVDGFLLEKDNNIIIKANFSIKLKDYKIKIPKIVMYKIAEEIAISVNIELKEMK